MKEADKIRHYLADLPLNARFTLEQVRRKLRLRSMQGKHTIFQRLVDDDMAKKLHKIGPSWEYQKIVDFTYDDIKPKYRYADVRTGPHRLFDAFNFGGNAERIVQNLYSRKEFV